MPHAFDQGFNQPQRTRIRNGAISLLSGLLKPAGYLNSVLKFGCVVRTYSDEAGVAALMVAAGRAPAIAIALGDRMSKVVGVGGYHEQGEIDLLVYFVSNNARERGDGRTVGRHEIDTAGLASDLADPGLDVMMDHAKELLLGRYPDVGADIHQIRPDREEELYTGEQVTIWMQTYKITVDFLVSEWRGVTQLLDQLRFRLAQDVNEVTRPDAPTISTTLDVNTDNLDPST